MVVLFATALAINLASWTLLLVRTWGLGADVPQFALHYTIYFGVDRLGPWWQIFRGPFSGFIILLGNTLLAGWFFSRERLWSLVIGVVTVLLEVLILLGSMLVVLLNV